jgi:nickel-dependent lactate racemase
MRVDFSFGKQGLALELPAGPDYQVLEARWARPLEDPGRELEQALGAPIGCAPLAELARGRRTAAISVCDITRPAPNRMTLPPVLRRLEEAGIGREDTTILIATGLHRPATEGEIREILGPEIAAAGYRIVNHDARDRDSHVWLGETSTGTPVWVDRRYVEADLHLTLGFIEPHLMAGFSGARKLIAPGLAYQDTIKTLHSPRFMRDARAVENSIEDNPLDRELWEIAALAGHDFALDVVLAKGKKIAQVFAGAPRAAHDRGVAYAREVLMERIGGPVDAVITTSAGYPLDLTFYQAVKGVTAAAHIVKPGGIILLLAECCEGAGAPEFSAMLKEWADHASFLRHIEDRPVVVDQWQLEKLALAVLDRQIWFHTPGLPEEYRGNLWGRYFSNVSAAVEALVRALPPGAKVAVIPEGPYVLARAEEPEPAVS